MPRAETKRGKSVTIGEFVIKTVLTGIWKIFVQKMMIFDKKKKLFLLS